MWIEDIIKALWILDNRYSCCVSKIENGVIYFTDGKTMSVKEGVEKYNKGDY